ncbi:MAG: dihydroorotate dehydrogenase [Chloroflexi bacterium]|nr:dihydroorotate dehydrogenase [Chloroflexota bacterium]
MAASGTFGYGVEYAGLTDVQSLGAIVCKGTTIRPRRGNPTPRIVESPAGMLNAIGLQNYGVERVASEFGPRWAAWQTPVLVNLVGDSIGEFRDMALLLDETPGIAGLELNISCPNVDRGGMLFGIDCDAAAEVTAAVRAATTLPVMVKLTPNVTDIVAIARAVADAGADSLSLINTLVGMAIDVRRRRPVLGNITGGLSGPAVKPIALRMVYQVAAAVEVPVVGIGGISSLTDALEFFMAGATAIQVGTANYVHPNVMASLARELPAWLADQGYDDLYQIIGIAQPEAVRVARFPRLAAPAAD